MRGYDVATSGIMQVCAGAQGVPCSPVVCRNIHACILSEALVPIMLA
jgi:hypothetical protein